MKKFFSAFALSTLVVPVSVLALSFAENTIFLNAETKAACEAQDGGWTEWYGEKYCTMAGFADVTIGHPHMRGVNYVRGESIVNGYPDGSFKPDSAITRVELVKIMVEASGSDVQCFVDAAAGVTDVDRNAWYYGYLSQAMCAGMVGGYPDNTFKPANPVTVAEASKIIANGFGLSVEATNGAWYEGFVQTLADRKALPTELGGVGAELTRGQMAEIIYRIKTENKAFPSHSMSSLLGDYYTPSSANTSQVDDAVDAEIDDIFDDLFEEDGLDLDGLLDF